MTRRRSGIALLAALAVLVVPAAAGATSSAPPAPPDRIDLPDGWQPEGITTDGRFLYAGSLADGAIWRARIKNGNGKVLAPGADGRVAVGVDYDNCRDLLWVAGGETKEIRAHDAATGALVETYSFPADGERFLNDIVVTRRGVYATDSLIQELAVVPLEGAGDPDACDGSDAPPPADVATTLPLMGDLEYEADFNLNGIVRSDRRLLAIQSNTGKLFRINREEGLTTVIDLDGETLTNGDGLEIDDDILYVVRNFSNLIAVVDLDDNSRTGELKEELTDDGFDIPTTAALARGSLWAVNARFATEPTPDTEYWITRLDAYDD